MSTAKASVSDAVPPCPLIQEISSEGLSADEWKARGNKHFNEGKYNEAIECYDKAIEISPSAPLYSNRSLCNIRLENYGYAVQDATLAIKTDPTFQKGYYRRGCAYLQLKQFNEAIADLKKQAELTPNNLEVRTKLNEARTKLSSLFSKAISLPSSQASALITSEKSHLTIPESYAGPRFSFPITSSNCPSTLITEETATWMRSQKLIPYGYVIPLLEQMITVFSSEPNLVTVPLTRRGVTVVGDTHGQFYDLLNIFRLNGFPSEDNIYVFNGDYVDRGSFSMEVILFLFLLKARYPKHLILLRGNHETDNMNEMYGFKGECDAKYNKQLFPIFSHVFNHLPICALLTDEEELKKEDEEKEEGKEEGKEEEEEEEENKKNKKKKTPTRVLCVHGGIPTTDGVKLSQIQAFDRKQQPPDDPESIFADLVWTDPQQQPGRSPSPRGVRYMFGPDVTEQFLADNDLSYIIRSHQVVDEGFELNHGGKCITVFSAPHYCDFQTNKGSIMKVRPRWLAEELKEDLKGKKDKQDKQGKQEGGCFWMTEEEMKAERQALLDEAAAFDKMGAKVIPCNVQGLTIVQFDQVPHPPVAAMKYSPFSRFGFF
ncbi:putative Serine/threonine-protein phosphatase 5 [Monocercomonoides exilis]|uniref:putative Serine/threonine-protein phosphatase 5 n=1 Tax=Monocercomonoides exilis TaxID=2049356 RepID=UPI00355A60BC|nr:putative Serine/threonine-protein phosphatase 5 [Monocercomonoides exilis]|eukprot:MONOS_2354.1-p1 / transcript=MONOS_2354.1 / gene=MONOS_2354 / organism=Monocercomonoides_exilis_PA203 / gene_product=Serine/threonine-protein phosphatase 5 / transcript_product=Serine/threonine-protein phosphatase 5 / location=Mono_scaffold00048:67909-70061(+) / protein_length=601 / sequence_SO=supercontig / SO=protein_coding / is_pseudo=false